LKKACPRAAEAGCPAAALYSAMNMPGRVDNGSACAAGAAVGSKAITAAAVAAASALRSRSAGIDEGNRCSVMATPDVAMVCAAH
jgi:hypothetical protein